MGQQEILENQHKPIKISVVHQPSKEISAKELMKALTEFHTQVQEEMRSRKQALLASIEDFSSKTTQSLKGNLSEFLSTPLRSDMDDIQKRIQEHAKQLREFIVPNIHNGIYGSSESKIVDEETQNVPLKSFIAAGKKNLKNLGFNLDADHYEVYTSDFVIEENGDFLLMESILNNILPAKIPAVYSSLHTVLYDLVIPESANNDAPDKYKIEMIFGDDSMDLFLFEKELRSSFAALTQQSMSFSLWRKKTISNSPLKIVCEIYVRDRVMLKHTIQMLADSVELLKKRMPLKSLSIMIKERLL